MSTIFSTKTVPGTNRNEALYEAADITPLERHMRALAANAKPKRNNHDRNVAARKKNRTMRLGHRALTCVNDLIAKQPNEIDDAIFDGDLAAKPVEYSAPLVDCARCGKRLSKASSRHKDAATGDWCTD